MCAVKETLVMVLFIALIISVGVFFKEQSIIWQCQNTGEINLWHSGYELTCKINKTGE